MTLFLIAQMNTILNLGWAIISKLKSDSPNNPKKHLCKFKCTKVTRHNRKKC